MDNGNLDTDQELLSLVAKGDEDAFRKLYDRYWKTMYSNAFRRLGDHDAVKDILQDIFLHLWSRRDSLNITNLQSYLFIAVRNRVLRRFEKESRYAPIGSLMMELDQSSSASDSLVLRNDLQKTYTALLGSLPPAQKTIVKMRFEEDLTTDEIARQLEISRKTVQNQLRTALLQIRSSMTLILLLLFWTD